jgi:hypothetical protein
MINDELKSLSLLSSISRLFSSFIPLFRRMCALSLSPLFKQHHATWRAVSFLGRSSPLFFLSENLQSLEKEERSRIESP